MKSLRHISTITFLLYQCIFVSSIFAQNGEINGDIDGMPFKVSWAFEDVSDGVKIQGNDIHVSSKNDVSFTIRIKNEESAGNIIKARVANGNHYKSSIDSRSPSIKSPLPVKITINSSFLNSLTSSRTDKLIISVIDVDNEARKREFFNVIYKPLNTKVYKSLTECKDKYFQAKIDCLNTLLPDLAESDKPTAKKEIANLTKEKKDAIAALNNFSVKPGSKHGEFYISCKDCDKYVFTINRKEKAAVQNKWRVKLESERQHTFTVKSKDWPSLKAFVKNKDFRPLGAKQENEISPSEEEVVADEEPNVQREVFTPEESSKEGLSADSFDADLPDSLTIPEKAAQGNESMSSLLALVKEYWYVIAILGPLLLLILLRSVIRGKTNKSSSIVNSGSETKIPLPKNENAQNLQTQSYAQIANSKENKNNQHIAEEEIDDFDIDIKEIEESSNIIEEAVHIAQVPINEIADHPNYYKVQLEDVCWKNTAVRNIYLSFSSIEGIDHRVRNANHQFVKSDNDISVEDLPETGGFLLGHVYELEKGSQFDVSFEIFVPITAESQDRYTVKFGDIAWSELDDNYKKYPGLSLVGWFHTHPGHGLFLSEADITEHKSLFQKPYQIAMEIDPLTSGFDAAFFTWQNAGEKDLNNIEQRIMDKWWSFRMIENQIWEKRAKN